jgi:hypothetical protein
MRTGSFLSIVVSAYLLGACGDPSSGAETADPASSDDALRSVAASYVERKPLSDTSFEVFRKALEGATEPLGWSGNSLDVITLEWSPKNGRRPLSDDDRMRLGRDGFRAFLKIEGAGSDDHEYLSRLAPVANTSKALSEATDAIGLIPESSDAATHKARSALDSSLTTLASESDIHVYSGQANGDPNLAWAGALVVVDDAHHQLLISKGGFGN